MKNKNGFVLAETLIVVLLLSITLMSLYSGFSSIIYKTRNKSNNDSIDTIYKTYYVKELLDNAYIYSYTDTESDETKEFSNSFEYYVDYITRKKNITDVCKAYSYTTGNATAVQDNDNLMLVCNYENYLNTSSSTSYDSDYMYSAIKSYGIEKIYYINYSKINNPTSIKALMNRLDASTIDYVRNQPKNVDGGYLVIKYRNKHTYPVDFAIDDEDFRIKEDTYHSSIQLTTISIGTGSSPIYLFESNEEGAKYMETDLMNYNDDYVLKSNNNFTSHPGSVIVGWTNSTDYLDLDRFNSCHALVEEYNKQGKSYYDETGILCGQVGETIKFNENTKVLYAVWCGNGKLSGALECQANYNKMTNNGLIVDDGSGNPYGETNYVYLGDGGDNFIKIGDYCYSMVSTYGSTDSIKVAYYGSYNYTSKACDKKDNYNSTGVVPFNTDKSAGYAWMYRDTVSIEKMGTSAAGFSQKLGLVEVYNNRTPTSNIVCKNGSDCYFGDDVSYDKNTKTYTLLDSGGKEVSAKTLFGGYDATSYDNLNDSKYVNKYLCEGGNTTKCSTVYYYLGKTGSGASSKLEFRKYKNGETDVTSLNKSLFFSKKISYSNGKYKLSKADGDGIVLTVSDVKNDSMVKPEYDNKTVAELLKTYKYACSDDWFFKSSGEYTCENAYLIVSSQGVGPYYVLQNGIMTEDDIYNQINGTVAAGNRTNSSTLKNSIDQFYEANLLSHESIIDKNVTFCNNQETMNIDDLVNEPRKNLFANHYKTDPRNKNLYKRYKDCDSKGEYLYSVSGATKGNHLLKYPVGLLTYEDATYIGFEFQRYSSNSYIHNGYAQFLLSPTGLFNDTRDYSVISFDNYGFQIRADSVLEDWKNSTVACRAKPVVGIYMDKDVVSGSGSYNNPFVLKES
ncbi:MAG: hypothetical protein K6E99_03570 [Bacilli bacterium]|nr:hypothetical protein [Bacilli bacterium]